MTLVTATRHAVAVLIGTRSAGRRTASAAAPSEQQPIETAAPDQPTQSIPVPDFLDDRPERVAPDV